MRCLSMLAFECCITIVSLGEQCIASHASHKVCSNCPIYSEKAVVDQSACIRVHLHSSACHFWHVDEALLPAIQLPISEIRNPLACAAGDLEDRRVWIERANRLVKER